MIYELQNGFHYFTMCYGTHSCHGSLLLHRSSATRCSFIVILQELALFSCTNSMRIIWFTVRLCHCYDTRLAKSKAIKCVVFATFNVWWQIKNSWSYKSILRHWQSDKYVLHNGVRLETSNSSTLRKARTDLTKWPLSFCVRKKP